MNTAEIPAVIVFAITLFMVAIICWSCGLNTGHKEGFAKGFRRGKEVSRELQS